MAAVRYGRWPGCGWKFYMLARWFTHTRTEFACVCAYVYIYGQSSVCECLFTCMYTDNTCLFVHVHVYAHRECICVYTCLHTSHVCVNISTYSNIVFMCDFLNVYIRLSSPRGGAIVSKCHKWPCHERGLSRTFVVPKINSKDVRMPILWNVLVVRLAECWRYASTWLQCQRLWDLGTCVLDLRLELTRG